MTAKVENIVTNDSSGYGYKYASLSDIAKQGFIIPKMKTGTEGEKEYVYYLDPEAGGWIRGAEIVIPVSKGLNKAQLYGSALTYARRYTTLMALSLACDDDQFIEDLKPEEKKASDRQISFMRKLYSQEEIGTIIEHYNVSSLEDLPKDLISNYINDRISSILCFIFALSNGIPMHIGGIANDGMNAKCLSKDKMATTAFLNQLRMNEAQIRGLSLNDMPDEWFVIPEGADKKNVAYATIAVLNVNRSLEKKDTEKSTYEIEMLLESDWQILGVHRNLLLCDLIHCRLYLILNSLLFTCKLLFKSVNFSS